MLLGGAKRFPEPQACAGATRVQPYRRLEAHTRLSCAAQGAERSRQRGHLAGPSSVPIWQAMLWMAPGMSGNHQGPQSVIILSHFGAGRTVRHGWREFTLAYEWSPSTCRATRLRRSERPTRGSVGAPVALCVARIGRADGFGRAHA